ncbi:MAG: autotransporter-associated beta strand protein, partial [Pirellulaceae bacterium]
MNMEVDNRINVRNVGITGDATTAIVVIQGGNDSLDLEVSSNSFAGGISIDQGLIEGHQDNALGTGTVTVLDGDAGVYLRNTKTYSNDFIINGDGRGTEGAIRNESGNNIIAGTVTMTGDSTIVVRPNTQLTITGALSGAHVMTKADTGKLILGSTANTYDALNLTGGSLQVKNDTGLGASTTSLALGPGQTLEFNPDADFTSTQLDSLFFNGGTLSVVANEVTLDPGTAINVGLRSDVQVSGDGDLVLNQSFGAAAVNSLTVTTGLQVWYDASTLALVDGAAVTAWADQSVNARDLVTWTGTPTFADNEINGLPAVRFDSNNENLQMADPSNEYFANDVFIVFRSGNGGNFGPDWGAPIGVKDGDDADRTWMLQGNEDRFWDQELPSAVSRNGATISSANNFDMGGIDASQYMVLNVTAGPNNGTQVREYIVGTRTDAWANSRFDTAEIIAYDRKLETTERVAVESYLSGKYEIGGELVNGVVKSGAGTLTLGGDNTFNGEVVIRGGTLVAAHNNALGLHDGSAPDTGGGTTVAAGGTLGLPGGLTINGEDLSVAGTIANISGDNFIGVNSPITGSGSEIIIDSQTAGDTLQIDSDIDLQIGGLTFEGDGDTLINGDISGDLFPGAPIPELGGVSNGLEMWFDAADIDGGNDGATGDPLPGATVQTWNDKSGNNHTATRANANPNVIGSALNGLPVVENINDAYFNVAEVGYAKTIFSVVRSTQATWESHGATLNRRTGRASNWLFENGNTTLHGNQLPQRAWKDGGNLAAPFQMAPIDQFMVLTVEVNAGDPNDALFYLGRSDCCITNIEMAEVIAYDGVLNDGDRNAVQVYLADKWGISGSFDPVSFSNDVTKSGDGTVTIAGDNTYQGETTVAAGTLVAASDTALGTVDGGTTVLDGGTLALDNTIVDLADNATADNTANLTISEALTISGAGAAGMGAISNLNGNNTIVNAIDVQDPTALPEFDLTDVQLWLDASDINGDGSVPADGATITNWVDKSGQGHDADVVSNNPLYVANSSLNNRPVVNFTNDQLATTYNFDNLGANYTIIGLSRYTGGDNERVIGSTTQNFLFGHHGNRSDRWYANGWIWQGTGANDGDLSWKTYTGIIGPDVGGGTTSVDFWANGTQLVDNGGGFNGGSYKPGRLALGGGNGGGFGETSNSEVAEVFIFDRALTDAERLQVELYLDVKYFGAAFATPGSGTATITSKDDTLTLNDDIQFAELTFDGAGDIDVVGDLLEGPAGGSTVVKTGLGTTTILSLNNTYTGPTDVLAGVADVDGAIISATTIQSGATLTGSGLIDATVAAQTGSVVHPDGDMTIGNGTAGAFTT